MEVSGDVGNLPTEMFHPVVEAKVPTLAATSRSLTPKAGDYIANREA
jgi:hypothetical protein